MSYSSASAQQVGVDLDHLAAYITVISHVAPTMAPENIGRALKTMSARMSDIKANKITEDDIGINAVESSLRKVNIELRDVHKNFRPMQDVLDEIGKKWATMDVDRQNEIIKNFAGKQQREQFLILMQNQALLQKAITVETESTGVAEDRYKIKLESAEAAQNKLTDAWQQTWQTTMNSDGLIFIDNMIAKILDGVSATGGWIQVITNLGKAFSPSLIILQQWVDEINKATWFWKMIEGIRDLKNFLESRPAAGTKIIPDEFGKNQFTPDITNNINNQKKAIDGLTDSTKKLNDAQVEGNKDYVTPTTDGVTPYGPISPEAIRPVFDLNSALEELNSMVKDTGGLMAKAASNSLEFKDIQELIAKNPDFIDMVSIENGQIVINTEGLRKLDLEKAKSALLTAQQVLQADKLNKASLETITNDEKTIDVMQKYVDAIIDGSAYASELAAAQKKLEDERKKAAEDALAAEKKEAQLKLTFLQDQKKAADELLKLTIAMIKQEKEAEKDHLNQQMNDYNDLIDKEIESLDALKATEDYKKGLTKDKKKQSDIKNQIAILSLDNSPEAKAKILKLQAELADQTDKINQEMADHKLKLEKEALQQEKKDFQDATKDKIKIIDNYLKQTGQITQDALDLINNHGKQLYDQLLQWNRIYGDGIDQTIIDAWNRGKDAVDNYQQLIIDINNQNALIAQLNAIDLNVTQPWKDAVTNGLQPYIDKLDEAKAKADALAFTAQQTTGPITGQQGQYQPPISTGTGNGVGSPAGGIGSGGGRQIMYHSGLEVGPAGGLRTTDNDTIRAMLSPGEVVFNQQQQANLLHNVIPNIAKTTSNLTNMGGSSIHFDSLVNVQGNVTEDVMPKLEIAMNKAIDKFINKGNFQRGIKRGNILSSI